MHTKEERAWEESDCGLFSIYETCSQAIAGVRLSQRPGTASVWASAEDKDLAGSTDARPCGGGGECLTEEREEGLKAGWARSRDPPEPRSRPDGPIDKPCRPFLGPQAQLGLLSFASPGVKLPPRLPRLPPAAVSYTPTPTPVQREVVSAVCLIE